MNIDEFEARVHAQKPVGSGHYDSEYFTGDWRAEGNNYSLETRRQIEAKNPFLIKDVFQPGKVLDLGCGPGALMHLLWEIGVEVEGIDFAESSPRLATPEVRDRITVGQVVDPALKPANAYDLVICREVLEHRPVLAPVVDDRGDKERPHHRAASPDRCRSHSSRLTSCQRAIMWLSTGSPDATIASCTSISRSTAWMS